MLSRFSDHLANEQKSHALAPTLMALVEFESIQVALVVRHTA